MWLLLVVGICCFLWGCLVKIPTYGYIMMWCINILCVLCDVIHVLCLVFTCWALFWIYVFIVVIESEFCWCLSIFKQYRLCTSFCQCCCCIFLLPSSLYVFQSQGFLVYWRIIVFSCLQKFISVSFCLVYMFFFPLCWIASHSDVVVIFFWYACMCVYTVVLYVSHVFFYNIHTDLWVIFLLVVLVDPKPFTKLYRLMVYF